MFQHYTILPLGIGGIAILHTFSRYSNTKSYLYFSFEIFFQPLTRAQVVKEIKDRSFKTVTQVRLYLYTFNFCCDFYCDFLLLIHVKEWMSY